MIAPIMIAVFCEGLRSVPRGWLEGSLALGVNRWRTFWKVGVRTARPAIVAGTVLATARALGEAVMLGMVSGSVGFAPNPADGLIFFVEPSRGLSATILQNTEELSSPPMKHTLFAIAAVLLFSSAMLSIIALGDEAADAALLLRGGGGVTGAPALAPEAVPARTVTRRGESSASWRLQRPRWGWRSHGPSASCSVRSPRRSSSTS